MDIVVYREAGTTLFCKKNFSYNLDRVNYAHRVALYIFIIYT